MNGLANRSGRTRRAVAATVMTSALALGLAAPADAGTKGRSHGTAHAAAPRAHTAAPTSSGNASDEWPITECGTVDGKGCAPDS